MSNIKTLVQHQKYFLHKAAVWPQLPLWQLLTSLLIIFGLFGTGAYVYPNLTQNRVRPGYRIGSVNLSFKTTQGAEAAIANSVANYRLAIATPAQTLTLNPAELGLRYDRAATMRSLKRLNRLQGSAMQFPADVARYFYPITIPITFRPSQPRYNQALAHLSSQLSTPPTNASVHLENNEFKVATSASGQQISARMLGLAIEQAARQLNTSLNLSPVTEQPAVSDAEAQSAADIANDWLGKTVHLRARGGKTYMPKRQTIAAWVEFKLTRHESRQLVLEPRVHKASLVSYLEKIAHESGDGLLAQNVTSAANRIAADLASKPSVHLNLPSIAILPTPPHPWNIYIEVNITKQWIYFVKDHRIVLNTGVSTGAAATPTPTGIFHILSKHPLVHMFGGIPGIDFYDLQVPAVMYFTTLGHAIHGTYWHNEFGPTWRGASGRSHGCVNLPQAIAWDFYKQVPIGTPVWTHY